MISDYNKRHAMHAEAMTFPFAGTYKIGIEFVKPHEKKLKLEGLRGSYKMQSVSLPESKLLRWRIFGVSLAKRFHVAVCLFSNRSQMTSKCGKNQ